MWKWFKKRQDLKSVIIEKEHKRSAREKLNIVKQYERAMRNQAESLQRDFKKELSERIEIKNKEIRDLKKLVKHLQSSFENLHSLSGELSMEFRTAAILSGKSQNRLANIADKALIEANKIEKKIEKVIGSE